MLNLSKETRIGIFVIAAAALIFWGFQFLKGVNILTRNNTYIVKYPNVDKLMPSAPVFISGLQVGIVRDIYLDNADDKTIITELTLDGGVEIPKNTIARIVGLSVMGGKAIDLYIPQPCSGGDCAPDGYELVGESMPFIQSILGDPAQLDAYTEKIRIGLTSVYDSLTIPGDPQGFGRTLVGMEQSFEGIAELTKRMNAILAQNQANLLATSGSIKSVAVNFEQTQKSLDATLENMRQLSEKLNHLDLESTVAKSGNAIDSVSAAVSELKTTLVSLKSSIGQTTTLLENMNKGEGTLGKLMVDDKLYQSLLDMSVHANLFAQDARMDPRRYNTVKLKLFGNKRPPYQGPFEDPAFIRARDSLRLNQ